MRLSYLVSFLLITSLVGISCQSPSHEDKLHSPQDFNPELSLFTLGVLIAAAADVANEDDLKTFGLFHIKSTYWDGSFPIRAAIRTEVKSWPSSEKRELLQLLKEAPSYWSIYSALILESLGAPPTFKVKDQGFSTKFNPTFQHVFRSRKKWQQIAARIYKTRDLEGLWAQHQKQWKKVQLTEVRETELKQAVAEYMRLDQTTIANLPRYKVIVNPLMAPGNGGNIFPEAQNVVLAVGPTDREGIEVVSAHEYMHQPVNLLVLDLSKQGSRGGPAFKSTELETAFETSECAMKAVNRNWGYVQWWNYATEALIRAASNRIVTGQDQEKPNFQFQSDFADLLVSFEKDPDESFEKFLVRALGTIKKRYCANEVKT